MIFNFIIFSITDIFIEYKFRMDALLKKLNFKDQQVLYVINPPESFLPHLDAMKPITEVKTSVEPGDEIQFAVFFAITHHPSTTR